MKNQVSIKSIIIMVSSIIGAIGVFLPWATMTVLGITISANGLDGGVIWWLSILLLFAVTIVLAAINIKKELPKPFGIGISVASAIAVILAIVNIVDTVKGGVSVGFGLYLILIFGIASAVLPWIPFSKKQNQ